MAQFRTYMSETTVDIALHALREYKVSVEENLASCRRLLTKGETSMNATIKYWELRLVQIDAGYSELRDML